MFDPRSIQYHQELHTSLVFFQLHDIADLQTVNSRKNKTIPVATTENVYMTSR